MKSTRITFHILITTLLVIVSSSQTLSRIRIRDKWFVDDHNRVVTLRGTNAVNKNAPWLPTVKDNDMSNLTQVENLKKWGFNVVRLGVMWSGVMPFRDHINHTYLDEMLSIVDTLHLNGIYVILDLHQDMLSSKFGSYDGVPLWLIDSLPSSRSIFPWPLKEDYMRNTSVFAAYITESCGFAFQCLYDNKNQFADYFEMYWSIVAQTFADRVNVLSYELINEPWPGDVYANPLLLLPGIAGRFSLMPLYDRAYRAIRRYDNETLVFYEPVTWGVILNLNYLGTGFTRPPGNDHHRTALSWHYYCWLLQFSDNPLKNDTYPTFKRVFCDSLQLKASFDAAKLHLGGASPTFLTEFGVCAFPTLDNQRLNTEECDRILDAADRYMQSWAYWDANFYHPVTLQIRTELVFSFSRVYPVLVNGIPMALSFNTTTREFLFKFRMEVENATSARLPTEIFIPSHVYSPNGFQVHLSSNLNWSFDEKSSRMRVVLIDEIIERFSYDEEFSFQQELIVSIRSN